MLDVLMPDVALKQKVAGWIGEVFTWYAQLTPNGVHLRPSDEQRRVFEEMERRLSRTQQDHRLGLLHDWKGKILIARGMLDVMLGNPAGGFLCYQEALSELDRTQSDRTSDTQIWLAARLAGLAEHMANYEEAEVQLERLLRAFDANPGRVVAAVSDKVNPSHWRRQLPSAALAAAETRAALYRRLLGVYMEQEKLSRYRKALALLENLIRDGAELDATSEEYFAYCRKQVRIAES